jgi:hypothetical protein
MAWTERFVTATAPGGGDGSQGLPWTLAEGLTNLAAGMRLNLLVGTYARSASISVATGGPWVIQGYSSTPGDGGRATIAFTGNIGGFGTTTAAGLGNIRDLIITSDTTNGNNLVGLGISGTGTLIERVTCAHWAGSGFQLDAGGVKAVYCEAYDCGRGNVLGYAGFRTNLYVHGGLFYCIAHDCTATNAVGFYLPDQNETDDLVGCIADTCTYAGFYLNHNNEMRVVMNCDAYNCGHGFLVNHPTYLPAVLFICCNAINNAGYGFYPQQASTIILEKCFDYGNVSGRIYDSGLLLDESASSHYTAVPYVDGPNGNFTLDRVNGASGRSAMPGFIQTGYSAHTTNARDVGAAQHADPALGLPAAGSLYAGKTVTVDGSAVVTGTLRASNISGPDAANAGENLSAPILGSGHTVDGIAGSLSGGGGGGMGGIFETIVR